MLKYARVSALPAPASEAPRVPESDACPPGACGVRGCAGVAVGAEPRGEAARARGSAPQAAGAAGSGGCVGFFFYPSRAF